MIPKFKRDRPPGPAKISYSSAIISVGLVAGFAIETAILIKIPVFGSRRVDYPSVLLGLVFLLLALYPEHLEYQFAPQEYKRFIINFLPRTARERFGWTFLSLATGIGEEIVYRAVVFGILFQATGNYWIAALYSAVLFALMHASQGLLSVIGLFIVALFLQWIVKISGGLYIAIAIHFIHNLFNGLFWGILTRQESNKA
jgi:membrane protease YdiL (CAAX protease family)